MARPTVSKMRARPPTAMVSSGRFSVKTWAMNYARVSRCACNLIAAGTYRWCGAGHEDQATEVGSALVAESAGGVEKRTNTVCLHTGADEGSSPCSGGGGSLLGLEELLLGVGRLCLAVGVAEDWAKNGEGDTVGEDGTERDGGRLNRGKV